MAYICRSYEENKTVPVFLSTVYIVLSSLSYKICLIITYTQLFLKFCFNIYKTAEIN